LLVLLQHGEIGIARVENGRARRTGNAQRKAAGAKLDRSAALRTVETFDVRGARSATERVVAQIREAKVVVVDVLAGEEQRRRLTEVDRGKLVVRAFEIDELDAELVPVLERKLAFDARVERLRDRAHDVPLVL
jgi:hypothetical protein